MKKVLTLILIFAGFTGVYAQSSTLAIGNETQTAEEPTDFENGSVKHLTGLSIGNEVQSTIEEGTDTGKSKKSFEMAIGNEAQTAEEPTDFENGSVKHLTGLSIGNEVQSSIEEGTDTGKSKKSFEMAIGNEAQTAEEPTDFENGSVKHLTGLSIGNEVQSSIEEGTDTGKSKKSFEMAIGNETQTAEEPTDFENGSVKYLTGLSIGNEVQSTIEEGTDYENGQIDLPELQTPFSKDDIKLFPTVSSDIIRITTDINDIVKLRVVSLTGEVKLTTRFENEINLDISNYASGIYIAYINRGKQMTTFKFIKK